MGRERRRARSTSKGGSVSNCSTSPKPSERQRNSRHIAGERRRTARERGNVRTVAVQRSSAMWVEHPPVSGQLHPQWPQLSVFPQPSFRAPRLSDLEKKVDTTKSGAKLSSDGESSDAKSENDKKKKKGKKEKKEKKEKKDKKQKKKATLACNSDEVDGGPKGMVSHVEPSDDEGDKTEIEAEATASQDKVAAGGGDEDASKKASGAAEVSGITEVSAERMKQALTALRERREELQEVNAELDKANAELDELDNQLAEAEEDLEKEREANKALTSSKQVVEEELAKEREANKTLVARTLEEQAQLKKLRSEFDDLQKSSATLTSDVSGYKSQLSERQTTLDECRKAKDALADELAQTKGKLAQIKQERSSAASEMETLRSKLTASQADLMVARESAKLTQSQLDQANGQLEKLKDGNAGMLQSKLKHARAELDRARKEMSASGTEIYNSRRKQAALEKELAKSRKLMVPGDHRRALNDAWEKLLGLLQAQAGPDELETGFDQLGGALQQAGFWKAEGDTTPAEEAAEEIESQPETIGNGASEPDPLLARLTSDADMAKSKRKHRSLDGQTLERLDKAEKKKEKKGKSDKKDSKESKEPKERKQVVEDQPADLELLPHRTDRAGPSSLKRRREVASSPASDAKRPNISFASEDKFVTQVCVTAFTSNQVKGKLWVANPLANVMCEKCERRVPQQQGRLQGNPGSSQFMQEKFHCHSCLEDR